MNTLSDMQYNKVQHVFRKGVSEEEVVSELLSSGVSEEDVQSIVAEWKKEKHARQQKMGLMLLVAGSLACFISCVFTMLNIMPALTNFFLYGMTSVGVMVVLGGLVMVFE
jgi:hypothetical protein